VSPLVEALAVNAVLAAVAISARLVRVGAAPGGLLVGTLIYLGGGRAGYAMLLLFFVVGVSVTKLGYREKEARGLAEPHGGRRGSAHALANGGVATLLSALALLWPDFRAMAPIGIGGAFAAALSDTVGSEIGQLYGKHPVSPLTFRRVEPGTEGAVSIEGTLASVAAAAAVAGVGLALGGYGVGGAIAAAAGGLAGSLLESVLGSVGVTRRMGHMALNLGNTLTGAVLALVFLEVTR